MKCIEGYKGMLPCRKEHWVDIFDIFNHSQQPTSLPLYVKGGHLSCSVLPKSIDFLIPPLPLENNP